MLYDMIVFTETLVWTRRVQYAHVLSILRKWVGGCWAEAYVVWGVELLMCRCCMRRRGVDMGLLVMGEGCVGARIAPR